MGRLKRVIGPSGQNQVNNYLDTVREVERRIQKAELQSQTDPGPDPERPLGVPASWEEHVKLMFDLQVLAFQTDITRVITFQLARKQVRATYPQIGCPIHTIRISHQPMVPQQLKSCEDQRLYVSLFAYFLDKLRSTPDGDGSLLDHGIFMYGSGMGNSDSHDHKNLPALVAAAETGASRGDVISDMRSGPQWLICI